MALIDIPFKPGIYTDDTPRDVGKLSYWKGGDKVRFYNGQPQKIEGWIAATDDNGALASAGVVRSAFQWSSLNGLSTFVAVGAHNHLEIYYSDSLDDITPLASSGALTNPFTLTDTSTTMTVAHTSHGRAAGDRVVFSGATNPLGGINPNGEYEVVSATANDYTVTLTSAATANVSGGGGTVNYSYEIAAGQVDSGAGGGVSSGGFGIDTYGSGPWGTTYSATGDAIARIWSLDQWGEDLVACPRGGAIYVWDSSAGTSSRATEITQAPETNLWIFVSYEDRHLVSLGAHDGASSSPMNVRWCNQEDYTDWTPSLSNTAGAKVLSRGSTLVTAARARGEHLIFTDTYIYSMTFVGPPDTFAFRPIADCGGIVGPNAVYSKDGIVYWMGEQNFYMYDGAVKPIFCPVSRHVFDSLNNAQQSKVYCTGASNYDEIWWFYPVSSEVDRYVIYNTRDGTWSIGTMDRTCCYKLDIGFAANGSMYLHGAGYNADTSAMNSYVESGDFEISDSGNKLMAVRKIIPDFDIINGDISLVLTGKRYPGSSTGQSATLTADETTEKLSTRVRARQVSLKINDASVDTDWRFGMLRIDAVQHGQR